MKRIIKRCKRVRQASTLSGRLLIGGGGGGGGAGMEVAQRSHTAAKENLLPLLSRGQGISVLKKMIAGNLGPNHTQ